MDAYADALGIEDRPKAQARPDDPFANLPPPQSGVKGTFTGDPAAVIDGIAAMKDKQERSNAKYAFEQQMRASGGKLDAPKDPYADALGIGTTPAKTTAAAPAPVAAAPVKPTLTAPDMKDAGAGIRSVVANQVSSLGANIVGGYRGLSTLLSGGTLDDAANNVRETVERGTYTPTTGPGATAVESFNSPDNPVTYPAQLLDAAGGKVTDVTGSPAAGALVNAGGTAALAALGLRGKPATAPVEVGPSRPAMGVQAPLKLADNPTSDVLRPTVQPQPAPVGATATAQPMPTTPEAVQAVAQEAPAKLFPQTPTTAPQGKFAPDDQLARARVLESVGIDPNKLRRSAITGDGTAGSTDFQTAKLDSPAGREMKAVIEGEKNALTNHADSLVTDTGGTHGVDQSALYARGNTILAPLDGLRQWFDAKTSQLYKAADERAQGVPAAMNETQKFIGGDQADFLGTTEGEQLLKGINARMKSLGMTDADGNPSGVTVQQAEQLKQYLNNQWQPRTSRLIRGLKDAIDTDVTSAAGEDIYQQARQMRALRGSTLDNPNGIAKLVDADGINRGVDLEKIPDNLTGMGVDQFSHVVKTIKEVPPELQPQAQAALAEIKAQFANKVNAIGSSQAGQWNAKGVTKYLQSNAARMAQVFSPEELAKFRNLNDAGHIVAKDQSYPGAAVQSHNLATQGVMKVLPTAGAAAGGFVGGPIGAAVGSAAGSMAAGAVDSAATLRAVRKRTVPLSELLDVGRGK